MKKAFRISNDRYFSDKEFEKHIEFVKKNIDTIDEAAIFFEYCHHAYMPKDELEKRADLIKRRIEAYRAAGVKSVGINVLNTIGQTEEAWDVMQTPPFRTMVGYEGFVSKACLCVNTKEFEEYTIFKYTLLANTNPDFIWLDDDMRIENHGSPYPCFCDSCLSSFNEKYGYSFDRESLVEMLNSPDGENVRCQWIKSNHDKLYNVARLCEQVIHKVNPSIITGLMGGGIEESWYAAYNPDTLLEALKGTKARPGGYFYNDDTPTGVISNITNIQRQTVLFSQNVNDIQYEYETYPYVNFGKSVKISDFEVCAAIMAGCNGIAFNTGYDRQNIADLIRRREKLYNIVEKYSWGKRTDGAYVMYSPNFALRKKVDGDFFTLEDTYRVWDATNNTTEIGIAQAGCAADSCVYILTDKMVEGYTDDELNEILKKNVLMDGRSAYQLICRGFADYIGVDNAKYYTNGVSEHYTEHCINGADSGYTRTIAMTFFYKKDLKRCRSYSFNPLPGAETVSEICDIKGKKLGICSTIFKNKYGGKIAVMGYAAFSFLRTPEKTEQLKNIFDWLTDGNFPVRICKPLRVMPIIRSDENDGILALYNCWYDDTENFEVEIRKENIDSVFEVSEDGRFIPAEFEPCGKGVKINVKNIIGWSYKVFVFLKRKDV